MNNKLKYWAEGNTNQAARNIYNILLKKNKLQRVKAIIQSHYDVYKDDIFEIVSWLDNNAMKPNGYRIDHVRSKNTQKLKQWDNDHMMMSDKNAMLNVSSFESIVLFLMQKDSKYLAKLEDEYASIKSKIDKLKGGSNTLQVVENFLKINCENTNTVKKIIKSFDRPTYKNKPIKYNGRNITEAIGEDVQEFFKDVPDIHHIIMYSSRTKVFDIWNITIFLLSLQNEELKKYYDHILAKIRNRNKLNKKLNKKQLASK